MAQPRENSSLIDWGRLAKAAIYATIVPLGQALDKMWVERILDALDPELSLICPHNLWYDKWNIMPGQHIHQEVEKGVTGSDVVVIFLSANSLQSGWVDKEWREKHMTEIEDGRIHVIAVLIDGTSIVSLPAFLKSKKFIRIMEPEMDSDFALHINELARGISAAVRQQE